MKNSTGRCHCYNYFSRIFESYQKKKEEMKLKISVLSTTCIRYHRIKRNLVLIIPMWLDSDKIYYSNYKLLEK